MLLRIDRHIREASMQTPLGGSPPRLPRRALVASGLAAAAFAPEARAASASELRLSSGQALERLKRQRPDAADLLSRAHAVLAFPSIVKAGLLIGGSFGDGVLRVGEEVRGYYRLAAGSYGLQAGAQSFSMVMAFMNAGALAYLDRSDGWQVGVGPSFVVADESFARSYTSTSVTQDVVVFIFGQQGAMAGLGVEGSKITRFNPG